MNDDWPELLTAKEAAKYFRVSAQSLYRLLKAGKIPGAFRVGSDWRINPKVLIKETKTRYKK